jgi:hypothetical protein
MTLAQFRVQRSLAHPQALADNKGSEPNGIRSIGVKRLRGRLFVALLSSISENPRLDNRRAA